MGKICNGCPYRFSCWWDGDNNYCQRDNEDLTNNNKIKGEKSE